MALGLKCQHNLCGLSYTLLGFFTTFRGKQVSISGLVLLHIIIKREEKEISEIIAIVCGWTLVAVLCGAVRA